MEHTVSKKLYLGSLPYSVDDVQLEELTKPFGEIISAKVIADKFSGQSKGFGFVEFANDDDAEKAIEGLNGKDLGGRALVVNEARPQTPRGGGGGGGGGGRGDRGRRDSGSRW
jgi:RNA recognition motif-containing protein